MSARNISDPPYSESGVGSLLSARAPDFVFPPQATHSISFQGLGLYPPTPLQRGASYIGMLDSQNAAMGHTCMGWRVGCENAISSSGRGSYATTALEGFGCVLGCPSIGIAQGFHIRSGISQGCDLGIEIAKGFDVSIGIASGFDLGMGIVQ